MPYTGNPATNTIDEIRLIVGDIWDDIEMLSNADYQYFLDRNGGNVRRAALDAIRAILFKLTRMTRERTGDIEVYGGDWFNNYRKALLLILQNPDAAISLAVPYAGGISKLDMSANDNTADNVTREVYIGFSQHQKLYNQCNPGDQYIPGAFSNGIYF